MGFVVIGSWVVGVLAALLSVLLWVNLRQLPPRAVSAGALSLGFLGCALAFAIPFLSLSATAATPVDSAVTIPCGSLSAPRNDFSAYQYTGEDSSDPKLQGKQSGSSGYVGVGADPQLSCQNTLSGARLGAIGGGALAAIALVIAIAHSYRKPGPQPDEAVESGSEAPDAEVSV